MRRHRRTGGAPLLLALKDDQAAEAQLVARHASLRGEQYYRLVPLAKTLERNGRLLGAVVCYRALLVAILARAYARANDHAAKYLGVLRRRLTQTAAAEILGLSQPKVSALLNGHFQGYSQERLIGLLNRLGCDVEIIVKAAPRRRVMGRGLGRVRLMCRRRRSAVFGLCLITGLR